MNKKISVFLIFVVCFSAIWINADSGVTIRAPAVSKTGTGYTGAVLFITVSALPGDGHIYVDTWPLTELDTQASTRLAVEVAGRVTGKDIAKFNFYYVIRSDSPVIGGPSAGGVMTVAAIAVLENWELDDGVMMTGMINPDSSIGPVGGIIEKLDASAELGIKKFLVPWGQTTITIQETTREERGNVIQIITNPKKINVVDYAREKYGIEVIEVEDINDAIFHFTGEKFTEKEIKGEIEISTNFLSEKTDDALERNIAYLNESERDLDSLDIDEYKKENLKEYLDTAEVLIDDARENIANEEYYTALSILFNSEIYIGVIDEYIHTNDFETRIEELDGKIGSIDSKLKETREDIRGIVSLEFLSAAEKRLKEAYDYLNEARNYNENSDTQNVAISIAYADKRSDTVELWLDLAIEYSKGEKISLDKLKEDAWKRIEEAKLVYVYVESLIGDVRLSDASGSLNAAQSEYDSGRYTSALFYAIESNIESNIALEASLSGDDPEMIVEKIQRAKNNAKVAIQLSREKGYEPMLAECYYEYGVNFEEKGDPANTFRMYKYSKEIALAYKHLSCGQTEPSASPCVPTDTQTSAAPETEEESKFILVVGSGLIGLVIGVIIGSILKQGK